MNPTARENLLRKIQDKLNQARTQTSAQLDVFREGVREEDDWLYVPVVARQAGVRASAFAAALSTVEKQIRDEESVKVLLLPAANIAA